MTLPRPACHASPGTTARSRSATSCAGRLPARHGPGDPHLPGNPTFREFLDPTARPAAARRKTMPGSYSDNVLYAAENWFMIKRHWVLERSASCVRGEGWGPRLGRGAKPRPRRADADEAHRADAGMRRRSAAGYGGPTESARGARIIERFGRGAAALRVRRPIAHEALRMSSPLAAKVAHPSRRSRGIGRACVRQSSLPPAVTSGQLYNSHDEAESLCAEVPRARRTAVALQAAPATRRASGACSTASARSSIASPS